MKKELRLMILAALFIGGLLSANFLGSKITNIFGVAVSVGIFAYPLTFMVTDVIAEVYGKNKAQEIVMAAFIVQVFVLVLTFISIKLPPASRYNLNNEYALVFGGSFRMIIASLIAFTISQTYDIWAFMFWKRVFKGKYLWIRNNASTIVSQAIDTLLFMFIAFYGISQKFTILFILQLSLSYWLCKIVFAILDTPFVYLLVNWLREE